GAKGLVEQVGERRVGAMTERIYALTARVFRPSVRLLRQGSAEERVEALTTLLFDPTKADLRRSILSGELELDDDSEVPRLGSGRSIAYLSAAEAAKFIGELEALVERFDNAHEEGDDERRPYALVWSLYPSSLRIR